MNYTSLFKSIFKKDNQGVTLRGKQKIAGNHYPMTEIGYEVIWGKDKQTHRNDHKAQNSWSMKHSMNEENSSSIFIKDTRTFQHCVEF